MKSTKELLHYTPQPKEPAPEQTCAICIQPLIPDWQPLFGGRWLYKDPKTLQICETQHDGMEFICSECKDIETKQRVKQSKKIAADSTILKYCESLPARYKDAKVTNFKNYSKPLQLWCADPESWSLFITSANAGSGKTRMAYALGLYWLEQSIDHALRGCLVFSTSDLYDQIRHQSMEEDESSIVDGLAAYHGLLILDDWGVEKQSEHCTAQMYRVLNTRYNNYAKTVITSNLSVGAIAELTDERLSSRLYEGSFLELDGNDRRMA